jgi:hypothetical protein
MRAWIPQGYGEIEKVNTDIVHFPRFVGKIGGLYLNGWFEKSNDEENSHLIVNIGCLPGRMPECSSQPHRG